MKKWIIWIFLTGVLLFGVATVIKITSKNVTEDSDKLTEKSKVLPEKGRVLPKKESITLAYDGWTGTYLPVYILKSIFDDNLGYTVEIADFKTIPAAFEAVASGRADIFTSAWFPNRNTTFDKYPNLVKLGHVYGGKPRDAYEGWMLSADVAGQYNVSHVKDLRKPHIVRILDTDRNGRGNLISGPDTWISSKQHPEILSYYGLAGLYEIETTESEKQFIDAVEKRFRKNKPFLFYMYQPAAFTEDILITDSAVWLKGTEKYLPQAFVRTVARSDLIVNYPEIAKILTQYKIPGTDIARSMTRIAEKGSAPNFLSGLAKEWTENHQRQISSWSEGIRGRSPSSQAGALTIAYSPEIEDLFLKLASEFNLTRAKDILPIHPVRLGMGDMLDYAVNGKVDAISPDSSVWLAQLDRMWQQKNSGASPLTGQKVRYAMSPIVIAMQEDKALEMGYPEKLLGWQELMNRVTEEPGFRWSHPSGATASGLLTITAEFYAGASKQSGLTKKDLAREPVMRFVERIESTVDRYGGESEDRMVIRMLAEGGTPLQAFVAQEQLVIYFNRNTQGEKLVAVYPREGTFWMDHPLVLLDGHWVTEEHRRAFRAFASFVTKPAQQFMALRKGYRPAQVSVSLQADGSLIRPEFKVDPSEPKTLLKVPSAGVVEKIRGLWRTTKKPANIYLMADVSGSMFGEKLENAKAALTSFADQIEGEHDKVALAVFSSEIHEIQPLDLVNKRSLKRSIRKLEASGSTKLYDAVAFAHEKLRNLNEPSRINTIVVMTDGENTSGSYSLEKICSEISKSKSSVLIFSVAYGKTSDFDVLQRISRLGRGRAYSSDTETIKKLYELISKFF
ncbi:MAG: solute-binding protein [Desulfobacteraceae bacterium]|nr:solute-binding protein [Desulfobacteraceae bacterium]